MRNCYRDNVGYEKETIMKLAELDKWYTDNELVYDDVFRTTGKDWGKMSHDQKQKFYDAENQPKKYYNNPKLGLSEKLTFEKSLDGRYITLFGWPLFREFMRTILFRYAQRGWRIRQLEKQLERK